MYKMLRLKISIKYSLLLDLRKAWAANIAIEWLLGKNFKQHYINTESENKKSGLIIIFYTFYSACPCKTYGLKCMPELKTLDFNFFFFFLLSM